MQKESLNYIGGHRRSYLISWSSVGTCNPRGFRPCRRIISVGNIRLPLLVIQNPLLSIVVMLGTQSTFPYARCSEFSQLIPTGVRRGSRANGCALFKTFSTFLPASTPFTPSIARLTEPLPIVSRTCSNPRAHIVCGYEIGSFCESFRTSREYITFWQ